MANGKKQKRNRAKKRNRRVQPRVQRGPAAPRLGELVATGVRKLISYLPGAPILDSIANVVFKGLGVSDTYVSAGKSFNGDVKFTGLMSHFVISPVNIMAGCPNFPAVIGKVGGVEGKSCVITQFQSVMVRDFWIKVIPTNRFSDRQGDWTLGVTPFYRGSSAKDFSAVLDARNPVNVDRMPYSATGPATSPLLVRVRVKPWHGQTATNTEPASPVFGVLVHYNDYSRSAYTDFTANDFGCVIQLGGTVICTDPELGEDAVTSYEDLVIDCGVKIGAMIKTKRGGMYLAAQGYTCKQSDDRSYCQVQGTRTGRPQENDNDFEMLGV